MKSQFRLSAGANNDHAGLVGSVDAVDGTRYWPKDRTQGSPGVWVEREIAFVEEFRELSCCGTTSCADVLQNVFELQMNTECNGDCTHHEGEYEVGPDNIRYYEGCTNDIDVPASGQVTYFLIRAENACGAGDPGAGSTGPRNVRICD